MKIETGYIYHIKNDFYDIVNDKGLMINHENNRSRPTYFTIKDNDILWFIPLSSKVEKYKKIISHKEKRFGECRTILIKKIKQQEVTILLQNAFPTIEKYISHPHIVNGEHLRVSHPIKREIIDNFHYMMSMKKEGINLFFTDIDKIKEIMEKELEKEKQVLQNN